MIISKSELVQLHAQNKNTFKPPRLLDLQLCTDGKDLPTAYTLLAAVINPISKGRRPYVIIHRTGEHGNEWLKFQDEYVTPVLEEEVEGNVCYLLYTRDDVLARVTERPNTDEVPKSLGTPSFYSLCSRSECTLFGIM